MTLEDPFYVVKDEVFKALNKTRGLYLRWQEISQSPAIANSPEVEWTSTELRNALRSIEWDLEDLEDTINIVERNSSKFKIDNKEICERRGFIEATKQEVQGMRGRMSLPRRDVDYSAREPLLAPASPPDPAPLNAPPHAPQHFAAWKSTPNYNKYSKLANQADSPTRPVGSGLAYPSALETEPELLAQQDATLAALGRSAGALRALGGSVARELDDHAVMLDELGTELENADSKLESTVKRVARVLRVNNDRRQWLAILALIALLFLALILFVIL